MKMRLLIIGMSIVMSCPVVAMRHSVSYTKPSLRLSGSADSASYAWLAPGLIAGAVAATYGVLCFHDWLAAGKSMWPIEERIYDRSKIYNWGTEKFRGDRPIEHARNSATYTNHTTRDQDQYQYYSFTGAVYEDLKAAYLKGSFEQNPEPVANQGDQQQQQQPAVRITDERPSDEVVQQFLFNRIQAEKLELERYLDTLAQVSLCWCGWYNIRKAYKQIARSRYGQEKDWSHKIHNEIDGAMRAEARTKLFHLLVGKPMYGAVGRLYWDIVHRYARLEAIEDCLVKQLGRKIETSAEERARQRQRYSNHAKQDQTLASWCWDAMIDPLYQRFFAA